MENWKELRWASPFPRLTIGLIFLVAGIHKVIQGLGATANWLVDAYAKTFLPSSLVALFGYGLPFLELILGFLLVLGLFRRITLLASCCLLYLLIFGKLIVADYSVVFQNSFFLFLSALGLALLPLDPCGLDGLKKPS